MMLCCVVARGVCMGKMLRFALGGASICFAGDVCNARYPPAPCDNQLSADFLRRFFALSLARRADPPELTHACSEAIRHEEKPPPGSKTLSEVNKEQPTRAILS